MCLARQSRPGQYIAAAPEQVHDPATLIARLRGRAQGTVLLGFDFPIGLPIALARKLDITNFRDALLDFGTGPLIDFFNLAERAADIAPARPFYPLRTGGTKRQHLVDGLGVDCYDDLYRHCDRKFESRGAASSMFWTLGGQQVGRAAIIGWRDVIQPALRDPNLDLAIWPFDGDLFDLLAKHEVVIVETYPAEACIHLQIDAPGRGWSKRSQTGRAKQSPAIQNWARSRNVQLAPDLTNLLDAGFGDKKDGEDPFDAMLGLLSMLEVALRHRPPGNPPTPEINNIEGWILGYNHRKFPPE